MPPSDPQTETQPGDELVAYLDGELAPEECRQVEDRLASDVDYRRRLHELDQAWEALDALPKPAVADNFARTTIEMVSVAAQRDVSEQSAKAASSRRRRRWGWAAVAALAAVAGFAVARSLLPDSNAKLLADLPVIQQFDVLSQIEDVEFLRLLPAAAMNEPLAGASADIELDVDGMRAAASPSLVARRKWVESLSPDKMASLEAQMQRFEALDKNPAEQNRLRALERQINQAADADLLRHRLVAYGRWLSRQLPGDQEDLRMLPTDERLDLVRAIVRDEQERAARRLSAEDAEKLRAEIMEIYQERKGRFLGSLRHRDPDNRRRFEEAEEPRRALMVLTWELRSDERDEKTRDRLVDALGSEAREQWNRISRRDQRRRQFLLWRWIWETMQPSWGPDELEKFFANELDNNQRAQLLSLRADEMQSELKRLYLASQFGLSDPNQLPGETGRRSTSPNAPPPDESRQSDEERSRDDVDRRGDGRRRRDNGR
ncbi:MAG TPA: hypothetical protein VJ828_16115 [Lacipirellulaceae bacterium]|nr:hypothetical protein [Lacipirellulaceae bacterium]